jgi:hypothetical protein
MPTMRALMRRLPSWLTLLMMLAGPMAQADAGSLIEVIDLQHRPATEVIPLVSPLLGPEDAVTGTGFQLIIRATPATIAQVREVLGALDTPARNLIVNVRRGGLDTSSERGIDVQGQLGRPMAEDRLGVRVIGRQTTDRTGDLQTLRVLEGQQAFIRSGESIPYRSTGVILIPGGVLAASEIDDRDLDRGFLVRPSVGPDRRVRLEILQVDERLSQMGRGRIDTQRVDTVLSGEIGEWIRIGGIDSQRDASGRWILGAGSQQTTQDVEIHVRVDLAD